MIKNLSLNDNIFKILPQTTLTITNNKKLDIKSSCFSCGSWWRLFSLLLFFFLFTFRVTPQAQQPGGKKSKTGDIFPLALVLEWADYASNVWKPDWPLEIPPDAFKVLSGEISFCEINGDDFSFDIKIDEAGRVEEFPFMLNGEMAQAALVYNGPSEEINELTITFPSGDNPWELEFLGYRNSFPYLVRAYNAASDGDDSASGDAAGSWYFIYYSWSNTEILETWYDESGNTLGIYGFTMTDIGQKSRIAAIKDYSAESDDSDTEFFYDSRGLITEISSPASVFSVLYFREDSPRYWERRPTEDNAAGDSSAGNVVTAGKFTFQWDETGLLTRLSGEDDKGQLLDCRYEYTLDETGNWIERRETRRIRSMGFLVPAPGATLRRVLEYIK